MLIKQWYVYQLIYKGIPYLNNLQEKQLKAKLTSQFSGAKRWEIF